MEMGRAGLRYFIRGRILCQKCLVMVVSLGSWDEMAG